MTQTVTLTQSDWAVVTAALLCLHDHDDARGADLQAVEAYVLRENIRKQLGWSGFGKRTTESVCGKDTGFAARTCVLYQGHTGKCDWKSR